MKGLKRKSQIGVVYTIWLI